MSEEAITVRMLRNDVSAILRRVEAGETFAVTRHGAPVARIGPMHEPERAGTVADLRDALARIRPDPGWLEEIRRDRDRDHLDDPWLT